MKCKNCGGNISIVNNLCVCNSCGSKHELNGYFENIDVYFCYVENDNNGRRTKDSMIAQDIYQEFQTQKIATFYSRISTDNLYGEDYEEVCLSALSKAKIVVLIGTSEENFSFLNEKYGDFYKDKVLIPIFSDISVSQIPKHISKIQALDYNKIGAKVDLVNGVLNILGREKVKINTSHINNKKKFIVLSIVLVCSLILFFYVLMYQKTGTSNKTSYIKATDNSVTEEFTEPNPEADIELSANDLQHQKYEQAMSDIEAEKYTDAIILLSELLEYKNSNEKLQLIYDKYAGYYSNPDDEISIHLITNKGFNFALDLTCRVDGKFIKITETSQFSGNSASFEFTDSENNSGTITLTLQNTTIDILLKTTENVSEMYIDVKYVSFNLSEKSDKPLVNISSDNILEWVKKSTTIEDLNRLGYETYLFYTPGKWLNYNIYKIKNIEEIQLITPRYDDTHILSIIAPADILIPDKIGETCYSFFIDNVFVQPNANDKGDTWLPYYGQEGLVLSKESLVVVASEASLNVSDYLNLYDHVIRSSILPKAKNTMMEKYTLDSAEDITGEIITENDTYYLLKLQTSDLTENKKAAWYKVYKDSYTVVFIKEGPYESISGKPADYLWFSEYIDFAREFPDLFDVEPGTEEWDDKVESAIVCKVLALAEERYPEGLVYEYRAVYQVVGENDTDFLICVDLKEDNAKDVDKCAWYRADKATANVEFIKEGPWPSDDSIKVWTWYSDYPDFTEEFPDAFDTKPGTEEWDELVEEIVCDESEKMAIEKYSLTEDDWCYADIITENDTHLLIYVVTESLTDNNQYAWYKADKATTTVEFIKEGPRPEYNYNMTKYLWFTEYSDFAKEFPSLYGDPDSISIPYLSSQPFTIEIKTDGCWIYPGPSHDYSLGGTNPNPRVWSEERT